MTVSYLNRAAMGGNINATYWLGNLIEQRRVMVKDGAGNMVYDPAPGTAMKQLCLQHGYRPETDTVVVSQMHPSGVAQPTLQPSTPQPSQPQSSDDSDSGAKLFAALAVGVIALAYLGSQNSNSDSSPGSGYDDRHCFVPLLDFSKPSGQTWVPAFGSGCDNAQASAIAPMF